MRNRTLCCVVGSVLVGAAWLTGACGPNFVGDSSQAGSGGAPASNAGRSAGGAVNGAGATHTNKGGSASIETGSAGRGASAGLGSGEVGGAGRAGGPNLNGGGFAGSGGSGLSGAGAGGGGTSGSGAAGAGGGGAGGTSGGGAGGSGAGGAGAGGGGTSGSGGGGAGGDMSCVASSTQTWFGCQAASCGACTSAPDLVNHPLYFKNHPSCTPIASCPNSLTACGSACPPPGDSDLCDGSPGQWSGCRGTGCYVCAELVTGYPKYFEHHPNCVKNGTCGGTGYGTCNANCPAPVPGDM